MPSSSSSRPRISFSTCRPASAPRPAGLTVPRNACSSSKFSCPTSWIVRPPTVNSSRVGAQARAVAVRAGVLDHHLVEPRLHPRVRLAALAVAAVVALDAPRDAAEADLAALLVVAPDLRVGRRSAARSSSARCRRGSRPDGRLGQLLSTASRAETERLRQAEHHPAVPGVGVVLERLAHEAAAEDAALRIGNQQLGVRQLVDAEAAARAAGALGVVEHEVVGADVAVDEVVRRLQSALVEALGLRLARALADVDLHQPVADQQRARRSPP